MNVLIHNPTASRGDARKREGDAVAALRAAGIEFDILHTKRPGHATQLARHAVERGARLVIAAGGDGTVHEVAQGMWDTDAVLGVIPMGTGNDFAEAHGIPRNLKKAVEIIRDGQDCRSDVGHFGEWSFFNTVGIGFDAVVSIKSRAIERLRGDLLYLVAVLKTFRSYRSTDMEVLAPGFQRSGPTYMLTVCIGQREGGGFTLAPDAIIDDGLFDVCLVDNIRIPTVLRMIPKAMKGTHTGMSFVEMLKVPDVTVTSPEPIVLHADGQIYRTERTTLEFRCEREALNVRMHPV